MREKALKNTNLAAQGRLKEKCYTSGLHASIKNASSQNGHLELVPAVVQFHVVTFSKMYTAGTTVLLERCPPYVHTSETPIECPPWWRVRHVEIENIEVIWMKNGGDP